MLVWMFDCIGCFVELLWEPSKQPVVETYTRVVVDPNEVRLVLIQCCFGVGIKCIFAFVYLYMRICVCMCCMHAWPLGVVCLVILSSAQYLLNNAQRASVSAWSEQVHETDRCMKRTGAWNGQSKKRTHSASAWNERTESVHETNTANALTQICVKDNIVLCAGQCQWDE